MSAGKGRQQGCGEEEWVRNGECEGLKLEWSQDLQEMQKHISCLHIDHITRQEILASAG